MGFNEIVLQLSVAVEGAGVIVIVITSLRALIRYFLEITAIDFRDIRLLLANGLSLGLEFKIGSEILRTVIAGTFAEIGFLAALIAVRAVLSYLLELDMSSASADKK